MIGVGQRLSARPDLGIPSGSEFLFTDSPTLGVRRESYANFKAWLEQSMAFSGRPWIDITNSVYGADPTGNTDSTEAILAAYADLPENGVLFAPYGSYIFTAKLLFAGQKHPFFFMPGATFRYGGSATDIDPVVFGNGTDEESNIVIWGPRFVSDTTMTDGAGVRFREMVRSHIFNTYFDHQDGTGKWFNAVWFDGVDFVTVDGFQARGSNDAIRLNGNGSGSAHADLFFNHGKIGKSLVGMHIGGDFGGLKVGSNVAIINNATNILINETLNATVNRQLVFAGCDIDSASTVNDAATMDGIGIDIQATAGKFRFVNVSNESAGILMRIGSSFNTGLIEVRGGFFHGAHTDWGGTGDGIQFLHKDCPLLVDRTHFYDIDHRAITNESGSTSTACYAFPILGANVTTGLYAITPPAATLYEPCNKDIQGYLQIGGASQGPRLYNSSGTLQAKNHDNSAYAPLEALSFAIGATPGVDGTFTTADSKTITVSKGIITGIE